MDIKKIKLYTADMFRDLPYWVTGSNQDYYVTNIEQSDVFKCDLLPCSIVHHVKLNEELYGFLSSYIPILLLANYVIYIKLLNSAFNKIKKTVKLKTLPKLEKDFIRIYPIEDQEEYIAFELVKNINTGEVIANNYDADGNLLTSTTIAITINEDIAYQYGVLGNIKIERPIIINIPEEDIQLGNTLSYTKISDTEKLVYRSGYSVVKYEGYVKKSKVNNKELKLYLDSENLINDYYVRYKDTNVIVNSIRPNNKIINYRLR